MPATPTTPAGATARPATTPRTKPAPERRRDLLDAGLQVFVDRGVAAATIDQITRAAGIAKGSFYLHFETKEHLLAALQADFETRLVDRLDAAAGAAGDDPGDRLTAWTDAAFAHFPDDMALHDVLFHHPVLAEHGAGASGAAAADDEHRDLTDSLRDVLEHGRAAGVFDVDDVELTAVLLCSALHSMFDRIWHREGDFAPERLQTATRRLFHRAVGLPA